jgi:flagellar basal-body rod protein FlgC
MSLFPSIAIAGTGINTDQTWLNAIASNVANVNDVVSPNQQVYQPQEIVVAPITSSPIQMPGVANTTNSGLGEGVGVVGVTTYSPNGVLVSDPGSPLANAQGLVRQTGVNLGQELGNLVTAQSSYQANASVITHAKSAYLSILSIGA